MKLFDYLDHIIAVLVKGPRTEDPLASLPVRPDGAITRELASDGTWQRQNGHKVPALRGIKGEWHGYDKGDDWESAFGFPNDCRAVKQSILYAGDKVVGQLWFYESSSHPELHVLFVFRSMKANADNEGLHMGNHDIAWFGQIIP